MIDLVRRSVSQAFARPAVELIVHLPDPFLPDNAEGLPLWEVLPQEPVGVLVDLRKLD